LSGGAGDWVFALFLLTIQVAFVRREARKRIGEFFRAMEYLSETYTNFFNIFGVWGLPQFIYERSEFVSKGTWMCL